MDATVWAIIGLGFVLGMEHALDADHVVAVSTIVSRHRNPFKAALVGISWGIGHTLTLLLVGAPILVFGLTVPGKMELGMEFVVGIVLVALGAITVRSYFRMRVHGHEHEHPEEVHPHFHAHRETPTHAHGHTFPIRIEPRSFIVGMFHGMAGSAALVLLALGKVDSVFGGIAYIVLFGVGSILGMLLISTAIGVPVVFTASRVRGLNRGIRAFAGSASILIGTFVMYEIAVVQGLFL